METDTRESIRRSVSLLIASALFVTGAGYAETDSDKDLEFMEKAMAAQPLPAEGQAERARTDVGAWEAAAGSATSNEDLVRRWMGMTGGGVASPMMPSGASQMVGPNDTGPRPSSTGVVMQVENASERLADFDEHLTYRDARYRISALGRLAKGRTSDDGFGAGIQIQGPDWYRDVDNFKHSDPKVTRGWRLSLSKHEFDTPVAGSTTPLQEEFMLVTAGVGWEYYFNHQWRAKRDEQGRVLVDDWGSPVKQRRNSPFLSAWIDGIFFGKVKGTSPAFVKDTGEFNSDTIGLTVGGGYVFGDKLRLGVEHSLTTDAFSATTVSLGSSF